MGEVANTVIPLNGGLNLVDNFHTLQQQPGQCGRLINFTPEVFSGYQKVRGYVKPELATQPTGTATTILGVYSYADGVLAIAGSGIYFSNDDMVSWVQLNRDTWVAQTGTVAVVAVSGNYVQVNGTGTAFTTEYIVGDEVKIGGVVRQISSIISDTEMYLTEEIAGGVVGGTAHYKNGTTDMSSSSAPVIPRTNQGKCQIAWYENDGDYGSLVITDTLLNTPITYLKIEGTGLSRTYTYQELGEDQAAPADAKYCCIFKERAVVAYNSSVDEDSGRVSYSERYDPRRFDGAGSGTFLVDGDITGIYPFKDVLIVFTTEAIYQFVGIEDEVNSQVKPITTRVGCPNGFTVQEVGGDLVFLASDGFRTLSATDQYGDVTLATISRKIDPLVKDILSNISSYNCSSTYIRERSQYRMWYTLDTVEDINQLGVSATLKRGLSGELEWQWAEIHGFPVACFHNKFEIDGDETMFHGGYDGYLYYHDTGNSFDGVDIPARINLHEFAYGDQGLRKTLHYVIITGQVEGLTDDSWMIIEYDYNEATTTQPPPYRLVAVGPVSYYGSAIFGTNLYSGTRRDWKRRILVNGSGYSNVFNFTTVGKGGSFSIDGIYVDVRIGPKW